MRFVSALRTGGAAVAVATLVAFATPALADHHHIKVAKSDKLGSYLTDAQGKTLYTFKKDSPGKSACSGDCVAKWPLYHAKKVDLSGSNLDEKDFATIRRDDGKEQTTYKGMPLYYFAGDKGPGDTSGQGVRDVWSVATP